MFGVRLPGSCVVRGLGEGALYGERSRVGRGDPVWVVFTWGPLLWADGQD